MLLKARNILLVPTYAYGIYQLGTHCGYRYAAAVVVGCCLGVILRVK